MIDIKGKKAFLESVFDHKSDISDHVVHNDFVDRGANFSRYREQAKTITDQGHKLGFNDADLDRSFEALKNKAEKVSDLREELESFEGNDIIKKGKADRLKSAERELKREAKDHSRKFKDLIKADQKSLQMLEKEHGAVAKEVSRDFERALKDVSKEVQIQAKGGAAALTADIKGPHGIEIKHGTSIKDAEAVVEQYGRRFETLSRKVEHKIEDLTTQHSRLGDQYNDLAAEIKESTGHDLMEGLSKTEKEAATSLTKAGEGAAAGAARGFQSKGMKVAAGAGAALLGFDGVRRLTSAESDGTNKFIGAAEVAGGAGLAWKGLFAEAKNLAVAAAHAR